MRRAFCLCLLAVLLLPACRSAPSASTPVPAAPPLESADWWNDAVFYEVFVRSFYDSSGDGIGDLPGLIQRLDYLNDGDPQTADDLGVTALWLMPVMQSPSYHGYDVVDYTAVETDYGTHDDFRALIAEAHRRGMRVVIDLPLNHTSSAHPWFLNASSGPDAGYRDWYVWSDQNPGYLGPWGEVVWHPLGGAYYYGVFWDGMPDLNYRNPEVTAQMHGVARFWLEEMGADGFRLDGVRHLIEVDRQQAGTPETHAWLADFDRFTDEVSPDVLTVGEVWDTTTTVSPYVADDEIDLAFEFDLAEAILESVDNGNPALLRLRLATVLASYPPSQFATFLTNHDQNRVMTQLQGDVGKARLAAAVLLALPGVPFIYYGEEIGLIGEKPDEMIRTPMQWTDGESAGFTSGRPWEPVNAGYEIVNVETESSADDSLLSHYRRLIALRNGHIALRRGGFVALESSCRSAYGFVRNHGDESVLLLFNFAAQEQTGCAFSVAQSVLTPGDYALGELLTKSPAGSLTVGADGDFSGYTLPIPLAPRMEYILLLE